MSQTPYYIPFLTLLGIHFALMLTCHVVGVEPIYKHIAPFYATLSPIHNNLYLSLLLPLTLLIVLILSTSKVNKYKVIGSTLIILSYFLIMLTLNKNYETKKLLREFLLLVVALCSALLIKKNLPHINNNLHHNATYIFRILFTIFLFSILLNISIASLRNGFLSIAEPYTRSKYEYVGDIGITTNIIKLLKNYHIFQPNLSLHAKLAPPGPLIILWLSSYIFGRTPLSLAIFTIIFGSTAIIPLYFWTKELSKESQFINPILICILYAVIPGIVIFSATSSEILYMPVLFLTLYLFEKSMNDNSIIFASLAGISFGLLSFFKFTLLSIAIYFLLKGIIFLISKKRTLLPLTKLAILMLLSFISFYIILFLLTGYRPLEVFLKAHSLFLRDLEEIESISPRYSLWWFKILNVWSWLYYAGMPITIGFLLSLFNKKSWFSANFYLFFITFLTLNLTYIAPGEGERSSLYIYPFLLLQSYTHQKSELLKNSHNLFNSIFTFQLFQSVLTECLFYTYW